MARKNLMLYGNYKLLKKEKRKAGFDGEIEGMKLCTSADSFDTLQSVLSPINKPEAVSLISSCQRI